MFTLITAGRSTSTPLNVFLSPEVCISLWVHTPHLFGADLFLGDRSSLNERLLSWCEIIDGASDGRNPASAICNQANSDVDIRQQIVDSDSICKIPAFCAIDTPKNHITLSNPTNGIRSIQIHLQRQNLLPST